MHFMRQTDSLSFVSQYFNNGFHFFEPQLFNLKNIDGRAACEFPILYYITSLLYIIIGKKLFLLKFIHLIISFTGLFYVYRLSYLILKDYVYSILIALFLCTSTVFNFYAFNYLPDAPALGFVFVVLDGVGALGAVLAGLVGDFSLVASFGLAGGLSLLAVGFIATVRR